MHSALKVRLCIKSKKTWGGWGQAFQETSDQIIAFIENYDIYILEKSLHSTLFLHSIDVLHLNITVTDLLHRSLSAWNSGYKVQWI